MKIFLSFWLAVSLVFSAACATKPETAKKRLLEYKDPVEALRFPEKEKEGTPAQPPPSEPAGAPSVSEDLDLQTLDRLSQAPVTKWVVVSGNNVPLRQGPGTNFKKVGVASKDEKFELLGIKQNPDSGQTWYLVQDKDETRFFVSSLFSSIEKEPEEITAEAEAETETATKEQIQKLGKSPTSKVRMRVDTTPPLPPSLKKAGHITLNFEDTDLYDVITTFSELLKIDYVIEGPVQGKVTLQTYNKIPVKDLYAVLEQILALNNMTVVKSGNFYRFLPAKDAAKKLLSIHFGKDPAVARKERMVIQIIPLKHISANTVKKIVTPLLTKNATFIDVPETNNLILIEMGANVRRVVKVVDALDVQKLASADIQLYRLQNADAAGVADELKEIFATMGYSDALDNTLTFLPLGRLNSILVVNLFEGLVSSVEFWIKKLDQPIAQGEMSTFVYYIQNGDAEKMAEIVDTLFQTSERERVEVTRTAITSPTQKKEKKQKTQPGAQPRKPKKVSRVKVKGGIQEEVEGELTVIPDKDTNSLIIRTNPRNYPSLLELIKKLDLLPQQVLIEVLILDLTIDEQTVKGLDLVTASSRGGVKYSLGSTGKSTPPLGSSVGTATASFLKGGSFLIEDPDELIAQLQVFASDSKVDILANPILVTSDNKEANISIADEIPIESATITTPTTGVVPVTQSSIEFRSVGIKLDILPKINSDNFVNLKIRQEISSEGPKFTLKTAGDTPSFITREVNTEVVLKDNQILVMGGLMRTDITKTTTGIPFLKDIPYIGFLFGSREDTARKTELMLFIIPHIMSNTKDSHEVTKQFKKRLGNLTKFIKQG